MARSDAPGAVSLRVPSHARRRTRDETGRPSSEDDRPRLRLVVTRGHLAIELDAACSLGPLVVSDLALALPQVTFPVELSGGVHAFRNKRGRLERLELALDARTAHRFARPRLEGLLPGRLRHHMVAPLEDGWLCGLAGEQAALAFEIRVAPLDGDLRFVPVAARGLGLGAPPTTLATRAIFALLKPYGRLVGGAVVVEGLCDAVVRELVPEAGMRVPASKDMRVVSLVGGVEAVTLRAEREGIPLPPTERAQRAVELASLVAEAESALMAGVVDDARRAYVEAMTRAPRHPEIAMRLAALDASIGGRAEAALGTLSDTMPVVEAGMLGAQLLAEVGDDAGAEAALRRAVADEPYGPLAALAWLELARHGDHAHEREALDRAVARAPALEPVRWARLEHHVAHGRLEEARGDLQHLEAEADGPHARHEVLRRAADLLVRHHAHEEAAAIYERALRHRPDSVDAVAGLAESLGVLGHRRRALELLGRAVALAERKRSEHPAVTLAFARALAEIADDRPAAIARVRAIPSYRYAAFEARLLEARWRAELGDLVGAGVALGRLAEAVETALEVLVGDRPADGPVGDDMPASGEQARAAVAAWLEEGARIQELDCRDLPAARRLLALALRLAPHNRRVAAAFKKVATTVDRPVPAAAPVAEEVRPVLDAALAEAGGGDDPLAGTYDDLPDMTDEIRAEQLTEKLRANPDDDGVASELFGILSGLGRTHDLLALVSARVEETGGDARGVWEERRRGVLQRLADAARAEGREDEAELYQLMLNRDD